jgi:hypothetical protein
MGQRTMRRNLSRRGWRGYPNYIIIEEAEAIFCRKGNLRLDLKWGGHKGPGPFRRPGNEPGWRSWLGGASTGARGCA